MPFKKKLYGILVDAHVSILVGAHVSILVGAHVSILVDAHVINSRTRVAS
jgi:hypothetical protein